MRLVFFSWLLQRNTAADGAELCLELFVGHLQNVDAQDDALDDIDDFNNAAGDDSQNDTQNAGLDLLLHKAGDTQGVEGNAHNAKYGLVHFPTIFFVCI